MEAESRCLFVNQSQSSAGREGCLDPVPVSCICRLAFSFLFSPTPKWLQEHPIPIGPTKELPIRVRTRKNCRQLVRSEPFCWVLQRIVVDRSRWAGGDWWESGGGLARSTGAPPIPSTVQTCTVQLTKPQDHLQQWWSQSEHQRGRCGEEREAESWWIDRGTRSRSELTSPGADPMQRLFDQCAHLTAIMQGISQMQAQSSILILRLIS